MRFTDDTIRGIIQLNKKGVIQHADLGLSELVDEKSYGKSIKEAFENYVFETNEKISNAIIQSDGKELCITQIDSQDVITLIVQDCDSLEKVIGLSEKNFERQIELFLKVMDNENDVTITNGKGVILKVSDSYEKHYEITKNEVIGKSIYELERRGVFSPSVTAIVLKEKRKATVMQKNKLGKNILTTGVPIFDENSNEIKYIVSFNSIDIADLTSTQEKYEKLKLLMNQYYSEINELKLKEIEISGIITKSASMENIFKMILNIADVDANVLITGETGVGKNLIGKLLHKKSNRSEGRFVEINCGAIPENLLESELFGYERGAFTGADKQGKSGKIYLAHKGTLFLDEIGELSLNMQKKLLQVIQEKKIIKVGGSEYIKVDFRLIAATNKNLKKLVDKGEFREDLYYRLNVLPVHIPPLRERKEDILPLIIYFLGKNNKKYKKNKSITQRAINKLIDHDWSGNVRELENIIERLVITTIEENIDLFNLPEHIRNLATEYDEKKTLKEMLEDYEQQIIQVAYERCGSTVKMSQALGIGQSSAVRKLQKYIKGYKHD